MIPNVMPCKELLFVSLRNDNKKNLHNIEADLTAQHRNKPHNAKTLRQREIRICEVVGRPQQDVLHTRLYPLGFSNAQFTTIPSFTF